MNPELKPLVDALLSAYPSFDAWFDKQSEEFVGVFSRQLGRVEKIDAAIVIDRLITGELAMPPNYEFDRVGILIRRECGVLRERRREQLENDRRREETFAYSSDASTATIEFERFFPAYRELVRLGELKKWHKITQEENDSKAFAVKEWYRSGGDVPSWMVSAEAVQ